MSKNAGIKFPANFTADDEVLRLVLAEAAFSR